MTSNINMYLLQPFQNCIFIIFWLQNVEMTKMVIFFSLFDISKVLHRFNIFLKLLKKLWVVKEKKFFKNCFVKSSKSILYVISDDKRTRYEKLSNLVSHIFINLLQYQNPVAVLYIFNKSGFFSVWCLTVLSGIR